MWLGWQVGSVECRNGSSLYRLWHWGWERCCRIELGVGGIGRSKSLHLLDLGKSILLDSLAILVARQSIALKTKAKELLSQCIVESSHGGS